MTKFGTIDFEDYILDALRDDVLVIFAGAGVSMGAPSNLSSFDKLANDIAKGTGQVAFAPLDRFLGQLHHKEVDVHERAAQLLSPSGSAPNALHHDLLRLFRSEERVRLVTTNFDHHFETAAEALFGILPDVYRAPALPLGRDFNGIVHVHGSLGRPSDMVLTDADFGRAYLTEGWARRFLVEVFRRYNVLFVGYSHDDVVMNYLARALPADSVAGRFVLTDEDGSWDLLGIKSIRFNKSTGTDAYKNLYDGINRLADRATRGALDWQARIAEIGEQPPADEEVIGEVKQALREVYTTRFFINFAKDAAWPKWLNAHHELDALFGAGDLGERDKLLVWWLAENFTIEHPITMFDLVAAHNLRLHPDFWFAICREIGTAENKILEKSALMRWVTILLASPPNQANHIALKWLADRCALQGNVHLTLKIFLSMCSHRLNIKPGFVWYEQDDEDHDLRLDVNCPLRADHWSLNEIWTNHLKPHISSIAIPLLSGITLRFEEIYQDLMAWDKASPEFDPVSYGRSAIEPHEQDRYPEAIDALIDTARESLEWLASNSHVLLDAWIDRLVFSEIPMLRRLAIHAVAAHEGKTADERLIWLMNRVGIHGFAEHHEIHRAIALCYPDASTGTRQAILDEVLMHKQPASDYHSEEERTARSQFEWLSWLHQAKPDCPLVEAALAPIMSQYPEWQPTDHPDLTHWVGSGNWVGTQSPWSVDQLLAREPRDQIDELITFTDKSSDRTDLDGLNSAIREACKQQDSWAFAFAEVLIERSLWSSDLWSAIIHSWQESDLTLEKWRAVLAITAKPELLAVQAYDISRLLYVIVRDGGKPFALELLGQANDIALPVWQTIEPNEQDENIDDWLSRAINRPAGEIVEFWINSLLLLMHGKSGLERTLPNDYKKWFTLVVKDTTSKGGLGRCVLASQTAFLFGLDDAWTREIIIPLFSDTDRQHFGQAWDGFLIWGRLYPALVDALLPAFIAALPRLGTDFPDRRRRFIEFYAALAVFHVTDPTQSLLPNFFQYGSLDDRISLASQVGYLLRQMQPATKQQMWNSWLYRYWQERQQAVPVALDEGEIRAMLEWLPDIGDSFPDAVNLAVRLPIIRIEHSLLPYKLRESDLVERFPNETAELLIYLCNSVVGYHDEYLRTVAARLRDLPQDLRHRLDEALARAGVM